MTTKLENLVTISNSSYLSELAKSPATAGNQRLLVSLCNELLSESDNFGRLIERANADLRCSKETVRELLEEIECDDYISHLQEEEISSLNDTVSSLSKEGNKYRKLYESSEKNIRELIDVIECDAEYINSLQRELNKYKKLHKSAEEDLRSSMESMAKPIPIRLRPLKFRSPESGMMSIAAKSGDNNEIRIAGQFDPKIKTV